MRERKELFEVRVIGHRSAVGEEAMEETGEVEKLLKTNPRENAREHFPFFK